MKCLDFCIFLILSITDMLKVWGDILFLLLKQNVFLASKGNSWSTVQLFYFTVLQISLANLFNICICLIKNATETHMGLGLAKYILQLYSILTKFSKQLWTLDCAFSWKLLGTELFSGQNISLQATGKRKIQI